MKEEKLPQLCIIYWYYVLKTYICRCRLAKEKNIHIQHSLPVATYQAHDCAFVIFRGKENRATGLLHHIGTATCVRTMTGGGAGRAECRLLQVQVASLEAHAACFVFGLE